MKHKKAVWAALLTSGLGSWLMPASGQVTNLSMTPAYDSSVSAAGANSGAGYTYLVQSSTWLDALTFPDVTASQAGKQALAGVTELTLSSIYDLTPGTLVTIHIYGSSLVVTGSSSPSDAQFQAAGLTDFGLATGVVQPDNTTLPLSGAGLDGWVDARDDGSSTANSLVLPYFGLGDDYFSATRGPQPELLTGELIDVVPEPSTWAAVIAGGALLFVVLRRRRASILVLSGHS
jgi:hypothetical protein